jgi:hypothetical protein
MPFWKMKKMSTIIMETDKRRKEWMRERERVRHVKDEKTEA